MSEPNPDPKALQALLEQVSSIDSRCESLSNSQAMDPRSTSSGIRNQSLNKVSRID
jgi:hypothetical protein